MEFGIWSDAGCIHTGFHTKASAEEEAAKYVIQGECSVEVLEVCADHPEQPSQMCEDCLEEE